LAGISLPGLGGGGASRTTDFDNHGDFGSIPTLSVNDFVDLNFGLTLQFGELGVAATGDLEQFTLTKSAVGGLTMDIGRWKALGAYGLFDGQLVVGGGARILTMQIAENGGPTLLTMQGVAPDVGALWMPTGMQLRLGAAARAAVTSRPFGSESVTEDKSGVRRAGNYVLPEEVTLPWEVEFGGAYQLGPRPVNPGWENPRDQDAWLRQRIEDRRSERALLHEDELGALPPEARAARKRVIEADEAEQRAIEDHELEVLDKRLYAQRKARYENWPREKILLLASVLFSGASSNAVSLQGFLDQRAESVGRTLTVTPRLGMEGEPLRDLLTLRVGTYVEPSRYQEGTPRQHFTFGGDIRLFPLNFWGLLPPATWKLAFFIDLAPRYENYGIGIGNWH
jgi:hypothetical protein